MKSSITILMMLLSLTFAGAQTLEFMHPRPTSNNFNDAILLPNGDYLQLGDASTVARSTDDGATWRASFPDTAGRDIYEATFVDGTTGYLCGTSGLLMKTTDGGATWSHISPGGTTTYWYLDFVDADTGIVVGNASTILKTTNGGASWTPTTLIPGTTLYKIHYVSPSTAYIGTANATLGRLLRSTDYGTTWTNVAGYAGTGTTRGIFFLNPDTGWVTNSDYVIFKTTDGGASFANQGDFGAGSIYEVKFTDPLNGVAVGAAGQVFFTTDGGTAWNPTNIGYTSNVFGLGMEGLLSSAGTQKIIVGGTLGAAATTTDWGATWTGNSFQLTLQELRDVEFITKDVGYAFGGSSVVADSLGQILKTTDGGATWEVLPFNSKHRVYSAHWVDANTGFLATRGPGGIFRTTDSGASFAQLTPGVMAATGIWNKIRFANTATGYACGSGGVLVKTTNGGTTWTDVPDLHAISVIYSLHVFDTETLISVGAASRAYLSTNGGTSWTTMTIPGASATLYDVYFLNRSLGFISASGGRAFKTTNGGTTWTEMTVPLASILYSVRFANPDSGWLAGATGWIAATGDGGATWTTHGRITNNTLYDLEIQNGKLWVAGVDGSILRAIVGDTTTVGVDDTGGGVPAAHALLQNYPNPFNPTTSITYQIPSAEHVSLRIYDVLGREVATLVNEAKQAGEYSVTWDATGMGTGVYFLRMTAGSHSQVRKMLLLK